MRLSFLFFCLAILAPVFLSAQTSTPAAAIDPRLYEVYEKDYLERLRTEQPTLILRWNFYLDNAFVVSEYPTDKGDMGQLPELQITDPEHFNILLIERDQPTARDWDKPVFYRIAGTNKILMYWSGKDFNRKFSEWLASR
ncbi:MAG: hypothetical protein JNL02_16500 [Saprospiraceae bacterium]|nr:hypothetical protein [Saprospiraceae bacterium]